MIKGISTRISTFFLKGHQRSLLAKKNIAASFLLKGLSVFISLLLVPMTINYVNTTQYGIWLTLSSLISWFGFMDIGFGHGLKNKLVEAISVGNDKLAKSYISTTYFAIGGISITLLVIFLGISSFLNWAEILNAPESFAKELSIVSIIVFSTFCLQFVFQLINIIAIANHNMIIPGLIGFLGNLLALIIVFILIKTVHGSLLILCLSIGISPLIILLLFNFILFSGKYKRFSPSYNFFKVEFIRNILQVGIKFFIIQIGLLFFYNIDNILISHIAGPSAVTSYNVAYRYFGVITIVSGILMTPFWTAFGDAHLKKDFEWIKKSVKKLEKIVLIIFIGALLMLFISSKVYKVWIGKEISIPLSLSAVLCFYTVFNTYRTVFVYYLNGTGKLHIQLLLVLIAGLLNIPLGILLGNAFGSTGVVLATALLSICCGVIEIVQYKKLINDRAYGIWSK